MKKIILASASPRRKELLEQIGLSFEVRVSTKEEIYHSSKPADIVKELAFQKADDVAKQVEDKESVIIAADTIVAQKGRIFGKPKDAQEAVTMLQSLQGQVHQVYTGVVLRYFDEQLKPRSIIHVEETSVYVAAMDELEIQTYVDSGESMDKAGGYAIQGGFAAFVERIEGDYYNAIGLPLSFVYQSLKHI